ncbi:MAG: sensor histidine kinase [Dissulfurimicrobium sp.]|uniref:sensor histidine kinase n=1 Tax=Dissulfurimicrobium sp. TaxID=2022436 RepID=UPI00404B04ED
MKIYCPAEPPEFSSVLTRIRQKHDDYKKYAFSVIHYMALMAFFDLAQEYETLDNFYKICVFVPKEFFGFDCCLYLVDAETKRLQMKCDSLTGLSVDGMEPPPDVRVNDSSYETKDSFITPIKGNLRWLTTKPLALSDEVIGMFEVFPLSYFGEKDRLFFEKYANRIGYNLHYKMIAIQNENHLKFINTLIIDIDHNVITPNMRYKVFLNNFRKQIDKMGEICKIWGERLKSSECKDIDEAVKLQNDALNVQANLLNQYKEIKKHYQNTSLFLESLLRREHFEKGAFVLKRRPCNFRKEIIEPQLERYRERLERRGIRIDEHLGGIPDEDIPLAVDIGLISQVYANLFSNAEKYCEEVLNEYNQPVKFMAYGREIIKDFFGNNKDGIKFNVFTTGPHLDREDAKRIFDEGIRGKNVKNRPGTGHGLHFIKKIIEVHDGVVGYEPTYLGNNFYFVLPLQSNLSKDLETTTPESTESGEACPI